MKSRILLCLIASALFMGCIKDDNSDCPPVNPTGSDMMDIIIHKYLNPDGANDPYQLVGVTPDGTTRKVLYDSYDQAICQPVDPSMGSDGETILFNGCARDVYTYHIPTGRVTLMHPINVGSTATGMSNTLFSPDMKEIFGRAADGELNVFNIASGIRTVLLRNGSLSAPALTASGQTLVFTGAEYHDNGSSPWDYHSGIMTMSTNGKQLKMVKDFYDPNIAFDITALTVVPATGRIIYAIRFMDNNTNSVTQGVYIMNLDGSGDKKLFSLDGVSMPEYISTNVNGSKLLYYNENDGNTINMVNLSGENVAGTYTIEQDGGLWDKTVDHPRMVRIKTDLYNSLRDVR